MTSFVSWYLNISRSTVFFFVLVLDKVACSSNLIVSLTFLSILQIYDLYVQAHHCDWQCEGLWCCRPQFILICSFLDVCQLEDTLLSWSIEDLKTSHLQASWLLISIYWRSWLSCQLRSVLTNQWVHISFCVSLLFADLKILSIFVILYYFVVSFLLLFNI